MRIVGHRSGNIDLEEFLSRPLFARLATASESGPRDSPVWFVGEDRALWIIGNCRESTFQDRIEREPRCAVGIVDFDRKRGTVQHVGFRGRATVDPFDRDRARRIFAKYLGEEQQKWDVRFKESLEDPSNLFVRFEPETTISVVPLRKEHADCGPK